MKTFFVGFITVSLSLSNLALSLSTNDSEQNKQYYLDSVKAKEAWNIQSSSYDVIVAIIDDGIYLNHEDLKSNLWTNSDEFFGNNIDDDHNGYIDDYYGVDFLLDDNRSLLTRGSHGTEVAGIIGGIGNNSLGISGLTWGVKLMPLIACDNQPDSYFYDVNNGCPSEYVAKAIRYAVDNGANIINLSLGGPSSTEISEAIKYAYGKGAVIVASAGNDDELTGIGINLDKFKNSPVCDDNGQNMVIGVSAVGIGNNALNWTAFGSCVDVLAPGEEIYTTGHAPYAYKTYLPVTGTSFATPMVSALAALIKQNNWSLSNKQIIDLIISTADPINLMNQPGKGLINFFTALSKASGATLPTTSLGPVHPNGTVILGSDNRTVFVIEGGMKRGFATPEEYNSQGFVFAEIVKANVSDLALSDGSIMTFSDGTLVLDNTDGRTVYIIFNGTKRGFTSEEVFLGLNYSFAKAVRGNLNQYATGNPIGSATEPHPEGTLIKDGTSLFKIVNGGRQTVPNMKVFDSWHWKLENLLVVNDADKALPAVSEVKFRNGSLLRTSNGAIYIVTDGIIRPFTSLTLFNSLGYKTTNAILVTDSEIINYELGAGL
jgi:hypothetical protein